MAMRPRSLARRLALQYLYMADLRDGDVEPVEAFLAEHGERSDVRRFARDLVDAVNARRPAIDDALGRALERWSLARVAAVERSALRIGCAELLAGQAPPKVALNEAIQLAKNFGGKDSGAFVNGILDRVRKDLEAARAADKTAGGGDAGV